MNQSHSLLVELDVNNLTATFVASDLNGKKLSIQVALTSSEFDNALAIFNEKPFGVEPHEVHLHRLKHGREAACNLRISLNGSRKDNWIPVTNSTLAGLSYVFNRFPLDPELLPEMPATVLQETSGGR